MCLPTLVEHRKERQKNIQRENSNLFAVIWKWRSHGVSTTLIAIRKNRVVISYSLNFENKLSELLRKRVERREKKRNHAMRKILWANNFNRLRITLFVSRQTDDWKTLQRCGVRCCNLTTYFWTKFNRNDRNRSKNINKLKVMRKIGFNWVKWKVKLS